MHGALICGAGCYSNPHRYRLNHLHELSVHFFLPGHLVSLPLELGQFHHVITAVLVELYWDNQRQQHDLPEKQSLFLQEVVLL